VADGERFGPVDVAEGLIGEEALCGEMGFASLQEVVQRLIRIIKFGNTRLSVRFSKARRAARGARPTVSTGI